MKIDFTGQVAVVTGGGGGIGRAVCLALAAAGAKVLVVDLDRGAAEATAAQVAAAGGEARVAVADVSRSEQVTAYVADAMQAWGRIDIFMNNAAWQGPIHPLVDYPEAMFDKVMDINVKGVFLGLQHVLPVMIAQGRGRGGQHRVARLLYRHPGAGSLHRQQARGAGPDQIGGGRAWSVRRHGELRATGRNCHAHDRASIRPDARIQDVLGKQGSAAPAGPT